MRWTRKDTLASVVMLAVVVPFVGYSVRGRMPFVADRRGMAGVILAGALALLWVLGRDLYDIESRDSLGPMLVTATVMCALLAIVVETPWTLLLLAAGGVVAMSAFGVVRHTTRHVAG